MFRYQARIQTGPEYQPGLQKTSIGIESLLQESSTEYALGTRFLEPSIY